MNNTTHEGRGTIGAAPTVTEATLAPIVADGMFAFTPFIASAVSDRDANPTDGGSYRNTEYTFFCVYERTSVVEAQ